MKRLCLPKEKRLITNQQFKAVLDRNLCVRNDLLMLYTAKNSCGYPRLGLSVAKTCGNAVVRNRLKRLLRAVFRHTQDQIPTCFDYLLIISAQWSKKLDKSLSPSQAAKQLRFDQVKASFLSLVAKTAKKIMI